jgi:hypothetical protein
VDSIPDPMLLRKSGRAGNRTRDPWLSSQELWLLDHRGGRYWMNPYLFSIGCNSVSCTVGNAAPEGWGGRHLCRYSGVSWCCYVLKDIAYKWQAWPTSASTNKWPVVSSTENRSVCHFINGSGWVIGPRFWIGSSRILWERRLRPYLRTHK